MIRICTVLFVCVFCLGLTAHAQGIKAEDQAPYNGQQDFKQYSVHYAVFNSTFIPADVAARYEIKRSPYESLINVSLAPRGEYGALPAAISGSVRNLMQQQKPLKFIEIQEDGATYYLAPIRVSSEEVLHFELALTPQGSDDTLHVQFSKKVYAD